MGVEDLRSTLIVPPPAGMVTTARSRAELIALITFVGLWLVGSIGPAIPRWSGLPAGLFIVLGLIVVVPTLIAIGWVSRPTANAAMVLSALVACVAIVACLFSATVNGYDLVVGPHRAGHASVLAWACLTALLSFVALMAVVGILLEQQDRIPVVERHTRIVARVREGQWVTPGTQPPALLTSLLDTPGVCGYRLEPESHFPYAVVGGERVVLICLALPDAHLLDELEAQTRKWQQLLREADSRTQVRSVLILPADDEPPPQAGQLFALGLIAITAQDLLATVSPWLGEPDHVSIPVAAALISADY